MCIHGYPGVWTDVQLHGIVAAAIYYAYGGCLALKRFYHTIHTGWSMYVLYYTYSM